MTSEHPVSVEVSSPRYFDRTQLLLRIVLAIVLGWIGVTAGWLVFLLYGALPVIAAIAISSQGHERYATETGPRVWRALAWLVQVSAYMSLVVDRFPTGGPYPVHPEIRYTGTPTAGSALSRLVTSIPSGVVLMVLWFVSSVLWIVAAVIVLFGGAMPEPLLGFQRGIVRWQARLVAYHASLVDEYPPFAFETGTGAMHAAA